MRRPVHWYGSLRASSRSDPVYNRGYLVAIEQGVRKHASTATVRIYINGALVGTFLGVFLAYGLVGPFVGKLKAVVEEDNHFYQLIKEVLVANLHNHNAAMCIEVGRQNTPTHNRPGFAELEDALKELKQAAA